MMPGKKKKQKKNKNVLVVMEAGLLTSNKASVAKGENSSQRWLVPSSRDVISETSHNHFPVLFYMPHYSSTLDVFVSSNVFHFNAVLSVC